MIAGLDEKTNEPFICGMDTIGAIETAKDFMVAGTAPDSLYGMCESMWQPDMVSTLDCTGHEPHPMSSCPCQQIMMTGTKDLQRCALQCVRS